MKFFPVNERGDVLIFVSGVNEITTICDAIKEYAEQQSHWIILPLHSGLSLADQDKVYKLLLITQKKKKTNH